MSRVLVILEFMVIADVYVFFIPNKTKSTNMV